MKSISSSQRAYLRAVGASGDYRTDAALIDAAVLLRRDRERRDRECLLCAAAEPAPTVREDLQTGRKRSWNAPMATRDHFIDPATLMLARALVVAGVLVLLGAVLFG